jgi:hypothetical protein
MVLAAAVALSGCAASSSGDSGGSSSLTIGQCFRGIDVNNFNVRDRKTLYVSTRQGYVFRLATTDDCFSQSVDSVVVSPFTGSDPNICVGDQAAVNVGRDRSLPVPCVARTSGPIRDSRESGLRSRSS